MALTPDLTIAPAVIAENPYLMMELDSLKSKRFEKLKDFAALNIINKQVFLAGGALRTLLTGENPADFDIFFRDLAEVDVVRGKLLAKGFVCTFKCPDGLLYSYVRYVNTPEGRKVAMKVQLITKIAGEPESVIEEFDLLAGMAALDDKYLYLHKEFVRDAKTKRLSINRVTYPVATIKRLVKYHNKGYNINEAALQFVEAMTEMAPNELTEENKVFYID